MMVRFELEGHTCEGLLVDGDMTNGGLVEYIDDDGYLAEIMTAAIESAV